MPGRRARAGPRVARRLLGDARAGPTAWYRERTMARRILRAMLDGVEASLPPELAARAAARLPWLVLAVAFALLATIPLRFVTWGKGDALLTLSDIVAATFAGLSVL